MAALHRVAQEASEAGVPCSVCGDIAEDPATAILLLGMGYDTISVAPHFFPEIKYVVRKTSSSDARAFAERVLAQTNTADVLRVMSSFRERLHGI